uniref:Reverse transcriptase domain-containing protein n=1 Tax=Caenorhabditis japonica TaxID=281687 RepID=A0A8R1HIN9_CAEJA
MNAYNEIIMQQLTAGIIELVPDNEQHIGPHYYIPHRVIEKFDSLTTKLRIVLDASSHMRNEQSLNDCIHPGPSILKSILGILLRSRNSPYLMVADLEKAFHQVRLQSKHRNVTKFLWLKDPSKSPTADNIVTYRFTRLPFGITASPFLLAITILLYMELELEPIHDKIKRNLYVDNVFFTPELSMNYYRL